MSSKTRTCRWVLVAYFAIAMVCSLLMFLLLGRSAEWINWAWYDPTGGKVLAAAVLALGIGSLLAARDPYRHRVMVQTLIVFNAAGLVGLLYRVLFESEMTPIGASWTFIALMTGFLVLFYVFYPQREE